MFLINQPKLQQAAEPVPAGGDPYNPSQPEAVPERPEHIPEKFWDAEKGELSQDNLLKSYTELETKIGQDRSVMRDEILTEMREGVPKEASEYLIEPEKLELPEGIEFDPNGADPLVDWWRETAHKMGLDNEGFNEGIKMYMSQQAAQTYTPDQVHAALGENGKDRTVAVDQWLASNLDRETYDKATAVVNSPEQIELLEAIIATKGQPLMGGGESAPAEELTRETVEAMMKDPRYWHTGQRDVAYVNEVQGLWDKLAALGKL